jgi:hypothetical protein
VGLASAQRSDPALEDALPGLVSGERENEPCPDDAITGQAPGECGTTQWYFYSDFEFGSGTLWHRTRGENFPRSGLLDPNDPNQWIGTITWYGVYVDAQASGCTKPHHNFRIRFYEDNNGTLDPNNWLYEEHVTAVGTHWGFISFCLICPMLDHWRFDAVLTVPRQMAKGWFSIQGEGTPGCFFLWEGSPEGDNRFAAWWETNIPGTLTYPTTFCDLNYCFGAKKIGACCDDRTGTCQEEFPEDACIALGGRFHRDQPCSSFGNDPNDPNDHACGLAPGACCHEDGTCAITIYSDCHGGENPCYPCIGDLDCDCDRDVDDLNCMFGGCDPWLCFDNWDCNGDGVINFDDLDCLLAILSDPNNWGPCGSCRGDCDCSGGVGFDDINPFVLALSDPVGYHAAYPNCDIRNADCNGDGVANFDDINPFVDRLGTVCQQARSRSNLWLGPFSTCAECCKVDSTDPNMHVTHHEIEPCGQSLNNGCNQLLDPNDPNSPPDPNAWEHLGVLDPNHPPVVCGTLWAENGYRDTDWYDFTLPVNGTLAWTWESDLPTLATPVWGGPDLATPTCVNQFGYWGLPRAYMCHPSSGSPTDVFPAGRVFWWVVLPDNGDPVNAGYPCVGNWNQYCLGITYTPLVCEPCLGTDRQESEPGCGPGYVDTFNSGCDSPDGLFHVQAQLDPNYWYCGESGIWADPNGNAQIDYDWWKVMLSGTVKKRLRFDLRSAFNMQWELYAVPGGNCANMVRLDYYEFGACDNSVSIYTTCLEPNGTAYYMRVVPTGAVDCNQYNTYRFEYVVVTEAPACTTCSVTCATNVDNPCQTDPSGPDTNLGCNAAHPSDPNEYMTFTIGNNTYGPKYCGRLSTFTAADGSAAADVDWFRYTQLASRTKLLIRGKAMFRMSINIANGCNDPDNVSHGWDRPCKGATTAATQTWLLLTPGTTYTGVVIYGNGGGDGTGEQPLKQFYFGLPCSDNRNTYELELQAQP